MDALNNCALIAVFRAAACPAQVVASADHVAALELDGSLTANCWAVGFSSDLSTGLSELFLHWNGSAWKVF